MSRSLATTSLMGLAVLLLMACSSPRKASERACRKAERHWARAVYLCPEMLRLDSAVFVSPPDSLHVTAQPGTVDVDSLLAACEELNRALLSPRWEQLRPIDAAPVGEKPAPKAKPSLPVAMKKIVGAACTWESFQEHLGRLTIVVKNVDGRPALTLIDPGETLKVPCPPAVGYAPCPAPGVAVGYKYFTWSVIGLFVLILIGVISWVTRGKWMGT